MAAGLNCDKDCCTTPQPWPEDVRWTQRRVSVGDAAIERGCMAGRMQAYRRGAAGAAWQAGVRDVRLRLACAVLAVGSNPV